MELAVKRWMELAVEREDGKVGVVGEGFDEGLGEEFLAQRRLSCCVALFRRGMSVWGTSMLTGKRMVGLLIDYGRAPRCVAGRMRDRISKNKRAQK
jgi:hypothetical protein